ncbi:phosphoenolpyruvate mutase [Paludibacterium paludis]|uniref:phosphoenolpyruvate mutase n=1 Tax=Paludibacterium paludis TaxID=1225769 RepID=A0A918U987_9NEIS|nr:phosphoenolpyruvate mutase [Paludibacterium paludis]GGY14901.1 phosphoenolpyruvate mutase [Paludibacterium paludis]
MDTKEGVACAAIALLEMSMGERFKSNGVTTEHRRGALKRVLGQRKCLRVMEAHSPISALLAENTQLLDENGESLAYDAFWSSSLTDSTERGKPDTEALDIQSRLLNINEIFDVTTRPLIMDGDTGGQPEHFAMNVRSLERIGVSAVIVEDKTGLKKNSLFGNEVPQSQESIDNFCHKIRLGKDAQITDEFMIIARVESLILEAGMDDALTRACAYVDAGADGIMIHSRRKTPEEVLEFAGEFKMRYPHVPLVCVPTSYAQIRFDELERAGFNIVIYANHMLRSSYLAMQQVAADILKHGRSFESEAKCLSISEILELIPGTH